MGDILIITVPCPCKLTYLAPHRSHPFPVSLGRLPMLVLVAGLVLPWISKGSSSRFACVISGSDILQSICRCSCNHSLGISKRCACSGCWKKKLLAVVGSARPSLVLQKRAKIISFGYHLTSCAKSETHTPAAKAPPSLTPANQWLTSIVMSSYCHITTI